MLSYKHERFLPAVLLAIVGCVYLLPTIYSIFLSLTTDSWNDSLTRITLQSYREIVNSDRLLAGLRRSLGTAAVVASASIVLLTLALKSYNYYSLRTRKLVLAALLFPLFIPETTHALTLSNFFVSVGVDKGAVAVALGQFIYVLPCVGVFILLQIASIPVTVFDAAKDLGLNAHHQIVRVLLPLLWPTLASGWIFAFFLAFNEYTRTMYLESSEYYAVFLTANLTAGGNRAIYAVSTLLCGSGILVLLALTIVLFRRSHQWRLS